MKIKIIKRDNNRLEFNIKGSNVTMANALRRAIISKIPMMAIEKVTFYDNSSTLNDEVLAHRLGMVPLRTDLKTYNFVEDCTCKKKGCAKCTAILTLDINGPGTVHSSELRSTDPKVVPIHGTIPITKLTEKQAVKLEAKAQLGTGREHMKWQGGLASYAMKDDGSIDFFVESFGQLDVKEMVEKSLDVVQKEIDELKSALK